MEPAGWVRKQIVFIAASDKTTVAFANPSKEQTHAGVALDNVIVTAHTSGRYAVTVTEDDAILLDTATGQAWRLQPFRGTSAWLPVERPEGTPEENDDERDSP